jgi:hypothetical protein
VSKESLNRIGKNFIELRVERPGDSPNHKALASGLAVKNEITRWIAVSVYHSREWIVNKHSFMPEDIPL